MADVSPAPPLVNRMLGRTLRGRYKIIQELGRGGFGDTYLALDEDLPGSPKRVVKHLKPKDPNPAVLEIARRLFKTEAEVLYRLKHPQIPELFAHFEENGEFYLVEDYIDGDDLSKTELTPGKRFREPDVIKLLQGILEVLTFVHQQNVIHRDINPKNLIRRRADGKLVLIDFGAVKEINTLATDNEGQTTATVIGTLGYTSGEQAHGQPLLCSDIYAVGIIGIQALTGIQPRLLSKDPKTLEIIWRDRVQVSPQLADILDTMVRFNFTQRYQSATEALQALAELAKTSPASEPTIISSLTNKPFLNRKIALLIGLVCGLVIAVIIIINMRPRTSIVKPPPLFHTPFPTASPRVAFSTYENPQDKIKINYPKSWEKRENPNPITREVVAFISPQESVLDTFRSNVIITVEPLRPNESLQEYTNSSKAQILQQNNQPRIINEKEEIIAGTKAYSIVYTLKDQEHELKRRAVWTVKNSQAYSVIYEAEVDEYDIFLGTVEKMLQSLQVE